MTEQFDEVTGTAIERYDSPAAGLAPMSLTDISQLGNMLVASGYYKDVRNASQAVAKILAGREYGLGPHAAMSNLFVIEGKVSMSAALIGAFIKRHPRYDYRVDELSDDACHLTFMQDGKEAGPSKFTMEDAKQAGLAGRGNWRSYPRNMLLARALTNGARWYCPDAFNGPIYTPDELGASVTFDRDGAEGYELPPPPAIDIAADNGGSGHGTCSIPEHNNAAFFQTPNMRSPAHKYLVAGETRWCNKPEGGRDGGVPEPVAQPQQEAAPERGAYNGPKPGSGVGGHCAEHDMPWLKTSSGRFAHPIKEGNTLIGWCNQDEPMRGSAVTDAQELDAQAEAHLGEQEEMEWDVPPEAAEREVGH